jgi:hypothetical protein
MPHRRLVQIGKPAPPPPPPTTPLPTVAQYFRDLSQRQGEDIRLLKERAEERIAVRRSRKSIREESWRLHPVIVRTAKKKAKPAAKAKRSTSKKRATTKRRSR